MNNSKRVKCDIKNSRGLKQCLLNGIHKLKKAAVTGINRQSQCKLDCSGTDQ